MVEEISAKVKKQSPQYKIPIYKGYEIVPNIDTKIKSHSPAATPNRISKNPRFMNFKKKSAAISPSASSSNIKIVNQ